MPHKLPLCALIGACALIRLNMICVAIEDFYLACMYRKSYCTISGIGDGGNGVGVDKIIKFYIKVCM